MPRKANKLFQQFHPLESFRYNLGRHDAVLPLSFLGVIAGILTGLIICLFRYGIEALSLLALHLGTQSLTPLTPESFEALPPEMRFFFPLGAAIILGLCFQVLPSNMRHTGLSHVVVRTHERNGRMPFVNGIVQFFGGIFALSSGSSGGQEGPAVHLGAASNSFLARRLYLPRNSMRILTACGTAAAIGASFNTPIAGVIFAMEVVMMEYTLIGFIPVILSAVSATTVMQIILGNNIVFHVPEMSMNSMKEFPYLLILGIASGVMAVMFMRIQVLTQKLNKLPILIRFAFSGLVTGCLAYYLPSIMGIGYDTVNEVLVSQPEWQWLIGLLIAKTLATAIANGVGFPVGIIGPSLFIGASLGAAVGILVGHFQPSIASHAGFYALLGMGGVMGALLNAPLAALIAILELAHTPEAMLPGITVIVIATLFTSQIFGQRSAVETVLLKQGINLQTHPVEQALNRISLSAVTDINIEYLTTNIFTGQLHLVAENEPRRIVLEINEDQHFLISRKSFLQYYEKTKNHEVPLATTTEQLMDSFKEMELPFLKLQNIDVSATVTEAREQLKNEEIDGLYVSDRKGSLRGVLLKSSLDKLIDSW